METVRVGIIGIGNMGSAHVVSLGEGHISGLTLTAVADLIPERLNWVKEKFPKTVCFNTGEALIKSGLVDAVILSAPHYFHPPLAVLAFENGLHVLTEKPAGVAVSQVQQMISAHQKAGTVFGIMFNQRTNPLFQQARKLVKSGALGQPKRLVWIITNWYRNQKYYDSGSWRATWSGEGGGVLLNQAPHNLDLWQWIFGMPKRIHASCAIGKYHSIEVEDDATIQAEYENGACATFITTTGEYPGTNRLEISGDLGKLVLEDGILKYWKLASSERKFCFEASAPDSAPPALDYSEFRQEEPETAHRGILQNFAEAILKGVPLLAPGEDGLQELTLSNAAYLSSYKKEWVELPLNPAEFDAFLQEKVQASHKVHSMDNADEQNGEYKDRWSVRW